MSVRVREEGSAVLIVTDQEGTERVLARFDLEDLAALEYLGKWKRPATDRILRCVEPWRAWRKNPETAAVAARKLQEAGWVSSDLVL